MLIYIEGNIGSGKSTFVKLLKNYLGRFSTKPILVQEPVDEWIETRDSDGSNILEKFYSDLPRWSFTFQMNSFISRAHKIQKERTPENNWDPFMLIERSIYTDRHCFAVNCYNSGQMTKMEYDVYCRWNDWLSDEFKLRPDGYIYLRCEPKVNTERICKRSRDGESGIPQEYLDLLHTYHEDWMSKETKDGVPVLTVDVNEDFTSDERMESLFQNIKEFCDNVEINTE